VLIRSAASVSVSCLYVRESESDQGSSDVFSAFEDEFL
jgi:hypothetical protein